MSTISVISLLLCDFVLQTCELIMDDFKKRSPGSIVIWSIIATQQPGAVDLLSIQPMKWYFQIIHSSFSSLQQTSIQVTAELIREKLSLCFSFCFSFSPPPTSEMTPPCLPPHPFILVFFFHPPLVFRPRPSSIYLPLPPAPLLSPPLAFKDDTSRAEREKEGKKRRHPSCPRSRLSSSSVPGFLPGVSLLVFI